MEVFNAIDEMIKQLNGVVWGTPMLVLILGTGFFLMLGLRLIPIRKLAYGFTMLWEGRKGQGEGDISTHRRLKIRSRE